MLHHATCPNCGARNGIPPAGLTMTCDYCGLSRPVPDADKRKQKLERDEQRRHEQLRAAQEAARRAATHREAKPRVNTGRWIGTAVLLVVFAPALVTLLQTRGVLDAVGEIFRAPGSGHPAGGASATGSESSLDPVTRAQLDLGVQQLLREGYTQLTDVRISHPGSPVALELKPASCYALLVAGSRPIVELRLAPPGPPVVAAPEDPARRRAVAHYCPSQAVVVQATVSQLRGGTFAWTLLARPRAAELPEAAPTRRSAKKTPRPVRSYGDRSTRRAAPPRPVLRGTEAPDRPVSPRPPPRKDRWTPPDDY